MTRGVVHIIDDDAAVRDSLEVLLDAAGFSVSAYASAQVFLDGLEDAPSGCIVTDVCMPQITGLDLLRRLDGRLSRFPVIVLTGEANVTMAVEALKNGAQDLIEKPFPADAVIAAIGRALTGMTEARDREDRRSDSARRLSALTAREQDVLRGLLNGASNKQIGRDLEISPRTVEVYRAKLMVKAGAESLSELVRIAVESGMADSCAADAGARPH